MPEMIALKPLKYPHAIAVGDRFTVTEKTARVLKLRKAAKDAEAEEPKRRYRRRDMVVEE
jgi:hypothetical protein